MSFANSSKSDWRPDPGTIVVPDLDEVIVWSVELENVRIDDVSALSSQEVDRANRFAFENVRRAFIQGRLFLRRVLARILDCSPAAIEFISEGNGKPKLRQGSLAFNLSHSGGTALLAVTRNRPVGVDLEFIRAERDLLGLAQRFFAKNEYDELRRLPETDQLRAFYLAWTRKEAFIKALGEGLSHPLDSFEVTLTPGIPAEFKTKQPDWRIFDIDLGERFAGAVVVPTMISRITCFQSNSSKMTP